MTTMSDTHTQSAEIAEKLLSEGERTLAYFGSLADTAWATTVYHDGDQWTLLQLFEHLVQAEAGLREMFESVARGGVGAPDGFDIVRFNHERTSPAAALDKHALFSQYRQERQTTAAFARALSPEQLASRGRHPAMGDASLDGMLRLLYLHNTAHIKDVKRAIAATAT